MAVYRRLHGAFGPQHWWPGDTPLEIIVGAILTQNTAWSNVEKAIHNLKRARALSSPIIIRDMPARTLAKHIRPAGYYNVKTRRLKSCMAYLADRLGPGLRRAARIPTPLFREELLAVNGIGPETADSILLYAFGRPVFVVDAYTRRICTRHKLLAGHETYDDIKRLFTTSLPTDKRLFNEYHALIVRLGKDYCRPTPRCATCPLKYKRFYR